MTESAEEFATLNAALAQELKPRGIIEQIYFANAATLVWEILRLRRCKTAIVNIAFKGALLELVNQLAGDPVGTEWEEIKALACDWFSEPKAKKEVSQRLAEYHLDEGAIEAEAIRSVLSELEVLDKMLTLLESRLNRTLRHIADYQDRSAKQVREISARVIEGEPVILENRSAKRSA